MFSCSMRTLEDIASIRKLVYVVRDGRIIDVDALPTKPVYFR